MNDFLDYENKNNLYNFLKTKIDLGQEIFEIHYDSFKKMLINENSNKNLNELNSNFLNFVMQKKEKPKRKFISPPTTNNLIVENFNPNFQPQLLNKNELLDSYSNQNNFKNITNEEPYENNLIQNRTESFPNSIDKKNIFAKQFETNMTTPIGFHPQIKNTQEQNIYLVINSRDRDITKFPFHDYFQIELNTVIKNICEIKCENIILPNINFFEYEPFLFLQIKEFDQIIFGSSSVYSSMFVQIPPCIEKVCQKFVNIHPIKMKKKYYTNPIASISRLTIRLCNSLGNPLLFPTDSFPVLRIENGTLEMNHLYKITLQNMPRNSNVCFYDWLKSCMKKFDQLFITGIPEFRQQFYYLDFDVIDVSSEIITCFVTSLKFSPNTIYAYKDIRFDKFCDISQAVFMSFNKLSCCFSLKVKYYEAFSEEQKNSQLIVK
jgi:hypothetical protein